jgi:hypothetical protein
MISKFMESQVGRIVISLILGFGLATIFKKVCKNNNCVVINGPRPSDVNQYFYKLNEDCYKYTPYITPCNGEAKA